MPDFGLSLITTSGKREGRMIPAPSTWTGSGLLAGPTGMPGSPNVLAFSYSFGATWYWAVSTTQWNTGGFRYGTNIVTCRGYNPYVRYVFHVSDKTSIGLWVGLWSSTSAPPSSQDWFNSISGIAVGFRSTDTNYSILYNDGTASQATQVVTYSGATIAKDANVHTVEIVGDDINSQWNVRIDYNPWHSITTVNHSPAQQTALSPIFAANQTSASGGTASNIELHDMYIQSDK